MTLRRVYEDPRTTTRNPELLAKRAGTTVKSSKAFLSREVSSVVRTAWRRPSVGQFAPAGGAAGHWQGDLIYVDDYRGVNDKRKAILTLLNTTTRYAIARPLLNARASTVTAALEDIIAMEKRASQIKTLRVDAGSEWGGSTKRLLRERGITLSMGEPNTHTWISRTDRLHRTLRARLGEHFERENTHRWIDVLPSIIANYNDTPHRTLSEVLGRKASPTSVTREEEDLIRGSELQRAGEVGRAIDAMGIVPGETRVRLLRSKTKGGSSFDKGELSTWSADSYLVLARNGVNSFVVDAPPGEVKIWPVHSLLVVEPKEVPGDRKQSSKVDIAVERAKRLESRNVSEAEQAAALAAPAQPKRVPKLTAKAAAAAEEKAAAIIVEANRDFARKLAAMPGAAAPAVSAPAPTAVVAERPKRVIRKPKKYQD